MMTSERKEPTPLSKHEIGLSQAQLFLNDYYSNPVLGVEELKGGKHSKAFSYEYGGSDLIIRFNPDTLGFLKDKYAFERLGNKVPIPKVLGIGKSHDIYYCITEKIPGETVRDQYNKGDFSSIPLLFGSVEDISKIESSGTGFGYLDLVGNAPYISSPEYINSIYRSRDLFDWDKIFQIPFVDEQFTDYVAGRMEYFGKFTTEKKELIHGDFGADNVFVKNNRVCGIIDWEKLRCGDHFLDIGRVLLFCPNRRAATQAAMEFYSDKKVESWKERVAMGIYHVVLTNYAYAALGGNEASCASSKTRLSELEHGLELV